MMPGAEGLGEFVVAGGDAAPVLQGVDGALDGIAPLVQLRVVADRTAPAAPSSFAMSPLVGGLGDGGGDAAPPELICGAYVGELVQVAGGSQ